MNKIRVYIKGVFWLYNECCVVENCRLFFVVILKVIFRVSRPEIQLLSLRGIKNLRWMMLILIVLEKKTNNERWIMIVTLGCWYLFSFDLFISFLYYCNKRVFTRMIFKIRSTFQGITISSQIHLYKQKNKVPKRGLRDSHLVPKERNEEIEGVYVWNNKVSRGTKC